MPSPDALVAAGAFLSVDISVPAAISAALTTAGHAVPPSQTGVAAIDTGASLTCVHEPLLTGLGLNPVGMATTGTAAGQVQKPLYVARLLVPQIGWTLDIQVLAVDLTGQMINTTPPQPIIALLGRNLLRNCVLLWNGTAGIWTLATP